MITSLQSSLSIIRDFLSVISSLLVFVIAYKGLQTWKKQLKGNTEYELARRLLKAVYKVRDSIKQYRFVIANSGEISQALKEAGVEKEEFSTPEYHAKSQEALYQLRWKKIASSWEELQLEAFEAEVIWGQVIKDKIGCLNSVIGSLQSYTSMYVRDLRKPVHLSPNEELYKKIQEALFDADINPDQKNKFTEKIDASISDIEEIIRPHLRL